MLHGVPSVQTVLSVTIRNRHPLNRASDLVLEAFRTFYLYNITFLWEFIFLISFQTLKSLREEDLGTSLPISRCCTGPLAATLSQKPSHEGGLAQKMKMYGEMRNDLFFVTSTNYRHDHASQQLRSHSELHQRAGFSALFC